MAKKEKTKSYPANIKTEAAKRLFDAGLIMTPEAIKAKQAELVARRKVEAQKSIVKGYLFNAFSNRRERRAAAKRAGYFKANLDGRNGTNDWGMYKSSPEANQQTVKGAHNAT